MPIERKLDTMLVGSAAAYSRNLAEKPRKERQKGFAYTRVLDFQVNWFDYLLGLSYLPRRQLDEHIRSSMP